MVNVPGSRCAEALIANTIIAMAIIILLFQLELITYAQRCRCVSVVLVFERLHQTTACT